MGWLDNEVSIKSLVHLLGRRGLITKEAHEDSLRRLVKLEDAVVEMDKRLHKVEGGKVPE